MKKRLSKHTALNVTTEDKKYTHRHGYCKQFNFPAW